MFLDALLTLSDAQALTATANSTNTIDFGSMTPQRDMGVGEELEIIVTVDVAADATTGDETYSFGMVTSAAAALTSPTTINSAAIARALLVAGFSFSLKVPKGLITQRYFGLVYTLGGTTPTVTVTAQLQPSRMASLAKPATHAKGFTIS